MVKGRKTDIGVTTSRCSHAMLNPPNIQPSAANKAPANPTPNSLIRRYMNRPAKKTWSMENTSWAQLGSKVSAATTRGG